MRVGAVILAAGFGTRLAPLTDATPKPLLEVGGRPVVDHLLDALSALGTGGGIELGPTVIVINDRHPDAWRRWISATPAPVSVVSNGVVDVS